jgi:hypothetical protein
LRELLGDQNKDAGHQGNVKLSRMMSGKQPLTKKQVIYLKN